MIPRPFTLALVSAVTLSAMLVGAPQEKPTTDQDGFPLSVWKERKRVTQIPFLPWPGSGRHLRGDLRQEFTFNVVIQDHETRKLGDKPDPILFARVLERDQPLTPLYSVLPQYPVSLSKSVGFTIQALVRPGKYKLELALLDRTSGRYSTRYEDVTIEGDPNDPLEKAFQQFSKFEFVKQLEPEKQERPRIDPSLLGLGRGGILSRLIRPLQLGGVSLVATTDRPSFVIDTPSPTHLSVITVLNPPEPALLETVLEDAFEGNLSNLLAVFTRLDVVRGTAQLTGVDLAEQSRVFDRVQMKGITQETLDKAIKKDRTAVSLNTLAKESDQGQYLRDVLKERLTEAEDDTSGARHAIIVVSASNSFPSSARLTISPARDCHCQVFYLRFSLVANEGDHIDDILKAYRPQVFDPLTWQEFREDFGKIYAQLLK